MRLGSYEDEALSTLPCAKAGWTLLAGSKAQLRDYLEKAREKISTRKRNHAVGEGGKMRIRCVMVKCRKDRLTEERAD